MRRKKRLKRYRRIGLALLISFSLILVIFKITNFSPFQSKEYKEKTGDIIEDNRPEMVVNLLTINPYSRPGTETQRIGGIVMHYTANPSATAMQNRDYFEGLMQTHATKASSHFIVGLDGEIVQCIPTWEVAYASNERNLDTISIECCHPDETGKFNRKTYASMVQLTAWLCLKFDLDKMDVIRHYDITGKICPKYFVENEEVWEQFQDDVKKALEEMKK